ncbi:DUF3006 domain-containing protein [Caldicoprobacter algeriensis]|uniref:DUF3006 domain-containing protein n=1 Tax=Caldicoprobacter algeriensis TaxID=699281 RepID=UPI00207A3739|nr:DUF3006 domain-containing protein [Caldicoprobacter algeriensis]MCM8900732.1 DUF3006 domain-containing protein [Caldicoprobacter algeriensis]
MKKVIVDRFEGDFAVCEDENRKMINIERSRLPEGVEEGTVLVLKVSGEDIEIEIDHDETRARKTKIKEMMDSLFS